MKMLYIPIPTIKSKADTFPIVKITANFVAHLTLAQLITNRVARNWNQNVFICELNTNRLQTRQVVFEQLWVFHNQEILVVINIVQI